MRGFFYPQKSISVWKHLQNSYTEYADIFVILNS